MSLTRRAFTRCLGALVVGASLALPVEFRRDESKARREFADFVERLEEAFFFGGRRAGKTGLAAGGIQEFIERRVIRTPYGTVSVMPAAAPLSQPGGLGGGE